ncbi:MAG: hypothetical protein ACRDJM_03800 [Actinomycetota bacterium]
MTRVRGPMGLALVVTAAAGVLSGWWGLLAFDPWPLVAAWLALVIAIPLLGGTSLPVAVLIAAALTSLGVGVFNALLSGSAAGLAVSGVLFWTAGVCVAYAARAVAQGRSKLVRS